MPIPRHKPVFLPIGAILAPTVMAAPDDTGCKLHSSRSIPSNFFVVLEVIFYFVLAFCMYSIQVLIFGLALLLSSEFCTITLRKKYFSMHSQIHRSVEKLSYYLKTSVLPFSLYIIYICVPK
jgi:hypothetical protein